MGFKTGDLAEELEKKKIAGQVLETKFQKKGNSEQDLSGNSGST